MIVENTRKHKITIANVIVFDRKATFDFQSGDSVGNSITQLEYESLMDNIFFKKMIDKKVLKIKKEKKVQKKQPLPEINNDSNDLSKD